MSELYYTSKKGKRIEVSVTRHALHRLAERYQRLYNMEIPGGAEQWLNDNFKHADRVKNLTRRDKERLEKYGQDNMFFRFHDFTFVVQNCVIVTIEISARDKRRLNRCKELVML